MTAAAFIIALAGIASRVLGLVRDRILAAQFGAGDTLDIYYAAFRIPDLLYNLLILGAMSAAFIPVFTSLISREKKDDAWELASGILNLQTLLLVIFSIIVAFFAPVIMRFLTPGFPIEKMESVGVFTRIMLLSPILLGISAIYGGILVSLKKFLIYSLAPLMYNIGIIVGALFFVKFWGPIGLAWGVVLGAFLHMLIQYPAVKFSGFKFTLKLLHFAKNNDVRKVFYLMIPRTLGIAVTQINLLVITIFASTLNSGSLSIFNFANNIQSAPLGIFGISFAVAVFPMLSSFAAKNEEKEFSKIFSETFLKILFFIIPISVFILILRAQIVRVFLGSGKFDWEDTHLTVATLGFLVLSLFAQSLIPLLTRSFYALQNTKTPFYIALVSEAINISLVILLIDKFSVQGLAIAFSVSSIANASILFFVLRLKHKLIESGKILLGFFKISLAAVGAGGMIQMAKMAVASAMNIDTFVGIFMQLFLAGFLGSVVFIYLCFRLDIEELRHFQKSMTRKIFRAKDSISEDTGEISGI